MPRSKHTADIPNTDQMLQVARLFYIDELTKQNIAQRLKIDPRKVTSLLEQARSHGIVKISLHGTAKSDLEQSLRAKFPHLLSAMIVPGPKVTPKTYPALLQQSGIIAADYFERLVQSQPRGRDLHIGITGGAHLFACANAVPEKVRKNVYVHVTALIGRGSLPEPAIHYDPLVNACVLWSRCGGLAGHIEYATVSPYDPQTEPGSEARKAVEEELKKVEENQTVRKVVEALDGLDVVFGGFGVINPKVRQQAVRNRITMESLLQSVLSPKQLEEEGARGDFSYCPFDADGNTKSEWRFFMTPGHYSFFKPEKSEHYWGIDFFKRMVATGKQVVAFGGYYQMPAVKIGLQAKICNVLITDEPTAKELVKGK